MFQSKYGPPDPKHYRRGGGIVPDVLKHVPGRPRHIDVPCVIGGILFVFLILAAEFLVGAIAGTIDLALKSK